MSLIKKTYGFVLSLLLLFSCSKNDITIEVEQDACKRFKISLPSYQRMDDPCNGGIKVVSRVSFDFNRTDDCLSLVRNSPVFYTSNNSEMNAIDYTITVDRENVEIINQSANYMFEASFKDSIDANALSHIILDFSTENELGVASNTLQIRINSSCATLDPSVYDVNSNQVSIPRAQQFFTIRLWDNAAEDGDIVSVYLNGRWIIENHSLLNDGTDFTFSTALLQPGANDLVVFALNEGSSGPNTVSIAINGEEVPNFQPGLLTGEGVRINF